jgi:filamentous hemagglutinin
MKTVTGQPLPKLGSFGKELQPKFNNIFAAKAAEIPGVDIPFRKVNPKYPANQAVIQAARTIDFKDKRYDCSEIAEDLLRAAKGKGTIIQVLPSEKGKPLTLYELGERREDMFYHQVYTDDQYVYDPRLSSEAIPKGDWEIMIRSLNPESSFQYLK